MSNLTIKECIYKDLDCIVCLQQQWSKEEITYGFIPADKSQLETKLGKYFLVAKLDNEIVGLLHQTQGHWQRHMFIVMKQCHL